MLIPIRWQNILQYEHTGHETESCCSEYSQIEYIFSNNEFSGPAEALGFILINNEIYSQWRIPIYKKSIPEIPPEQNLESIDLFNSN
jgi:hypothetical protein